MPEQKRSEQIQTREVKIGELTLREEGVALLDSVWPSVVEFIKLRHLGMTALEYAPIPFVPWWAVGDAYGVKRAVNAFKQSQRYEGWLKLITAVIPLIPTGPSHAVITAWMEARRSIHASKQIS